MREARGMESRGHRWRKRDAEHEERAGGHKERERGGGKWGIRGGYLLLSFSYLDVSGPPPTDISGEVTPSSH